MPSLPIVPTQVTLKGNVGFLDATRTAQLFTFGTRGQGISLRGSRMVSTKSAKIRETQWHAQSAHCPHTGHVKLKCGFSGKSAKNRGSQWHAQSAHCAHTGHAKGKCGFSGRS